MSEDPNEPSVPSDPSLDAELSKWAEELRREPPAKAPLLTPDAIFEQAAKDSRRERLQWVQQVVALLFATGVFLGLVVETGSQLQAGLAAIVLPTLFAGFALFIHFRQSTWKAEAETVASHVAITIARRQADHRLIKINQVLLAFLMTVFFVWHPFFVREHADKFLAQPWRLAIAICAVVPTFGGAFWYLAMRARKTRAELARWIEIRASL